MEKIKNPFGSDILTARAKFSSFYRHCLIWSFRQRWELGHLMFLLCARENIASDTLLWLRLVTQLEGGRGRNQTTGSTSLSASPHCHYAIIILFFIFLGIGLDIFFCKYLSEIIRKTNRGSFNSTHTYAIYLLHYLTIHFLFIVLRYTKWDQLTLYSTCLCKELF